MGFFNEVIAVNNDINYLRYNSKGIKKLTSMISSSFQIHKLKKLISNIKEDEISTKLISEYADYYLESLHTNSDMKKYIKQILKGKYENATSITFELPMVDNYLLMVTANFTDRYSTSGNYIFTIIGSNSSCHINYTMNYIAKLEVDPKIDMSADIGGMTRADKVEFAKNYFIQEITKSIKEFLYSNIGTKELQNGEPS